MRSIIGWFWCLIVGHDVVPTGRKGVIIYQVKCLCCKKKFVAYIDDDAEPLQDWDQFYEDYFKRNHL